MLKKEERVGETNTASCGQKMTIMAYRNSHDLDVEFEDGTIVNNIKYSRFKLGYVKNPNAKINHRHIKLEDLIGKSNTNSYGELMTIIGREKSPDCRYLIQFEDGTIVKRYLAFFESGKILNPNTDYKKYHVGEESQSSFGQKIKIIKYCNINDIDVEFDDNTIVKHTTYSQFKKGTIRNPNYSPTINKMTRLWESSVSQQGEKMIIVGYRNNHDIDVQFEDGTFVYNKAYHDFKNGAIRNPNNKWLMSSGCIKIKQYLDEAGIKYRTEYTFEDRLSKKGIPLRDDFAIMDTGNNPIAMIEFHGRQHYEEVDLFKHNSDSLKNLQTNDEIKSAYLKEKSIPQLVIPYWEQENIEVLLKDFFEENNI